MKDLQPAGIGTHDEGAMGNSEGGNVAISDDWPKMEGGNIAINNGFTGV